MFQKRRETLREKSAALTCPHPKAASKGEGKGNGAHVRCIGELEEQNKADVSVTKVARRHFINVCSPT